MPKNDTNTPAATVLQWLREQLGPHALAPLTSTDSQALRAAVEIVRLWATCDEAHEDRLLTTFGAVVLTMQPHCREFAFHAVAHVGDWSTRRELWRKAGLPQFEPNMSCRYE